MERNPRSSSTSTAKVLVLGEPNVGKTCLRSRFVRQWFPTAYRATINSDFLTAQVTLENQQTVQLQIWDTAGQERFNSIGHAFYRGADVAIVVFDITKGASFSKLSKWLENVREHSMADPAIVLAGNKCDLKEYAVVSDRQVTEFVERWQVAEYVEVSAKEDKNVERLFETAAQLSVDREAVSRVAFDSVEVGEIESRKGRCC